MAIKSYYKIILQLLPEILKFSSAIAPVDTFSTHKKEVKQKRSIASLTHLLLNLSQHALYTVLAQDSTGSSFSIGAMHTAVSFATIAATVNHLSLIV